MFLFGKVDTFEMFYDRRKTNNLKWDSNENRSSPRRPSIQEKKRSKMDGQISVERSLKKLAYLKIYGMIDGK